MDDVERLQARQDAADLDASRPDLAASDGAPVVLGKTVAVGTYPTNIGRFFWVTPNDVTGTETEGSAGTLTAAGEKFLALHLGATVPPVGTPVVCTRVAHRWIFPY